MPLLHKSPNVEAERIILIIELKLCLDEFFATKALEEDDDDQQDEDEELQIQENIREIQVADLPVETRNWFGFSLNTTTVTLTQTQMKSITVTGTLSITGACTGSGSITDYVSICT